MTDGDREEEERYGQQRPDVAEMQSRCDREGGTLQLDPATGLLSACVSSATGRVLFRETHYHDGVADGRSGYTPLHYAARSGHADCVALLLRGELGDSP